MDASKKPTKKCGSCKKLVKTGDQGLQCEYCTFWYHDSCADVNQDRYDAISNSGEQTHWFCKICNLKVMDTLRFIQSVKDDNEVIKAELTTIKTQVNDLASKFESDMRTKPSHQDVEAMIEDKIATLQINIEHSQVKDTPQVVSSVLSEINQRRSKLNNIIIHGIEESRTVNSEARTEHDTRKVRDILQVCGVKHDESSIARVYRPGIFDKDKGKRPLIATLNKPELKSELFKNASKLRNSDHELKEVRIGNDLTRTERVQEKELYEKSKQMQEQSGEHRFRVRGPPWARRIVKMPLDKVG
jgi:hypothetical protein